jgi:hypothetical protein
MDPQVETIIAFALEYRINLDAIDACLYIKNRAALAKNPTDPELQRVSRHFESLLWLAVPEEQFFDRIAQEEPECRPNCPECAARLARQAQSL